MKCLTEFLTSPYKRTTVQGQTHRNLPSFIKPERDNYEGHLARALLYFYHKEKTTRDFFFKITLLLH